MLIDIIILVYALGYVAAWRKLSAVLYATDYKESVRKREPIGWPTVVLDAIGGAIGAVLWPIIGTCVFIRRHSTPETAAKRLFGETAKQKVARQEQEKRTLAKRTKELEIKTGVTKQDIPKHLQNMPKPKYYSTWD